MTQGCGSQGWQSRAACAARCLLAVLCLHLLLPQRSAHAWRAVTELQVSSWAGGIRTWCEHSDPRCEYGHKEQGQG